jgi:hypothetical protein
MKVIKVDSPIVIDGRLRVTGEIVQVPDNFNILNSSIENNNFIDPMIATITSINMVPIQIPITDILLDTPVIISTGTNG